MNAEKWLDEYTRVICEGLLQDCLDLISEDVRFHGMPGQKPLLGRGELERYFASEFGDRGRLPVIDFTNVEIDELPGGTWKVRSLQTYYPPVLPFIQAHAEFTLREEDDRLRLTAAHLGVI